jgi:nickel superoxide dismutase
MIFLMLRTIIRRAANFLPAQTAYAHCDIPCGIYDPYPAQIAAHSIIRMTSMIQDLHAHDDSPEEQKKMIHQLTRLTKVKEDHADILKHEIAVIWGDYFKPEMLAEHKNVHELVFSIMKLASKTRQEINLESAKELLTKVQEFAEIFWKTKKRLSVRIASPYPTGGELVVPK